MNFYKTYTKNYYHFSFFEKSYDELIIKIKDFFYKTKKQKKIIIEVELFLENEKHFDFLKEIISINEKEKKIDKIFILINEHTKSSRLSFLEIVKNYFLTIKKDLTFEIEFLIISNNSLIKNKNYFLYYPTFLFYNKKYLFEKSDFLFDKFFKYKKNNLNKINLFTSFNQSIKEHRLAFAYYIQQHKFKHEYYLSLNKIEQINDLLVFDLTKEEIEKIKSPLYLDIDFTENQMNNISSSYYIKSFISHINESKIHEDSIFLSESTYKSIIMLSPFTIMGAPFILQELKEQGFDIDFFGINNSYDYEKNEKIRLNLIIEEIKKLDQLSNEDLLDLVYQNKEKLILNRENLITLQPEEEKKQNIIEEIIVTKFNNL